LAHLEPPVGSRYKSPGTVLVSPKMLRPTVPQTSEWRLTCPASERASSI